MTNDDKKRPMVPRIEEERRDDNPITEPMRDDGGWQRMSPDRPPFTDMGDSPRDPRGMDDDEAGEAERIAAAGDPREEPFPVRDGYISYDPPKVEAEVEVDVPASVAYNQWTQFEEFPQFMEGVESVEQLDDKRLRWVAQIAGKRKEWTAEISEQQPDRCIAWHSTSGARNAGRVDFEPLGADRCRVHLVLDYEPESTLESAGDALGLVKRKVKADMERFKKFIESRGVESGAWRGRIHGGREE